jgi:hypothetical protein
MGNCFLNPFQTELSYKGLSVLRQEQLPFFYLLKYKNYETNF